MLIAVVIGAVALSGNDEPASSGADTFPTQPSLASATDGDSPDLELVWTRVPHDESAFGGSDHEYMGSVAAGESGFVAVGEARLGGDWVAAVWRSADGITWTRIPHNEAVFGGNNDQDMTAVAASESGFVAVGYDWSGGDGGAAVWHSADGTTWNRIPHSEAVFEGTNRQYMDSVVAIDSGFIAVGHAWSGGDSDAAVWQSADGITWNRVPHNEGAFGGPGDQEMMSVVAGESGFIAVGHDYSDGDSDAAVWQSADGITWNRIPHNETIFGGTWHQIMESVAAGESGFIAVGHDDSGGGDVDAAVWQSPDGTTWNRIPHNEAVFGGAGWQEIESVVATESGYIAVGYDSSLGDPDAAVWQSPDGTTWNRMPHNETVFGGAGWQEIESVVATESGFIAVGGDDSGGDLDAAVWTAFR